MIIDWESSRAMHSVLLNPGDPLAEHKSELLDWVEAVCGEKVPRDQAFEEVLRDGVILCNMMNKLLPGSIPRVHPSSPSTRDQWMQNHEAVRLAMRTLGVAEGEIYSATDLTDGNNIKHVVKSLAALARIVSNKPNYQGPEMSLKTPVLFHWEEQELRVVSPGTSKTGSSSGTSKDKSGSSKRSSQVGICLGNQETIQE